MDHHSYEAGDWNYIKNWCDHFAERIGLEGRIPRPRTWRRWDHPSDDWKPALDGTPHHCERRQGRCGASCRKAFRSTVEKNAGTKKADPMGRLFLYPVCRNYSAVSSSLWPISACANLGLIDSKPINVNQYPTKRPKKANIEKHISATTKNTRNHKNFIVVDLSRCKDSNTNRSIGNLCLKFVVELKSYNHTSEQHGI